MPVSPLAHYLGSTVAAITSTITGLILSAYALHIIRSSHPAGRRVKIHEKLFLYTTIVFGFVPLCFVLVFSFLIWYLFEDYYYYP